MSDVADSLKDFRAEELLRDSHIVDDTRQLGSRLLAVSIGDRISIEDRYKQLVEKINELPVIQLEDSVPPGTENSYKGRLISGLETVLDACNRVNDGLMDFQAYLETTMAEIKARRSAFVAWYSIALAERRRLQASVIKALAEAEFTRLMASRDLHVELMLRSAKTLSDRLKAFRKAQQERYHNGEDQVNAWWAEHYPTNYGPERPAISNSSPLISDPKPNNDEYL